MSIEYSDGDIFESGCQALVCPVNCVGVMGKGLALEFKKRFPAYFDEYETRCRYREMRPGQVWAYKTREKSIERVIFSLPTKTHWKLPSSLWYVRLGLEDLGWYIKDLCLESIAIPALGCGLGGLEWEEVKPLIEKYLGDLDCRVVVFPPKEVS